MLVSASPQGKGDRISWRGGPRNRSRPTGRRAGFLRRRPSEDEATDITDKIHPSYIELVERALSLMPALVWCGADLIIPDIAAPATSDNYDILELNAPARFVDHHHPWRGQPRREPYLGLSRRVELGTASALAQETASA